MLSQSDRMMMRLLSPEVLCWLALDWAAVFKSELSKHILNQFSRWDLNFEINIVHLQGSR